MGFHLIFIKLFRHVLYTLLCVYTFDNRLKKKESQVKQSLQTVRPVASSQRDDAESFEPNEDLGIITLAPW